MRTLLKIGLIALIVVSVIQCVIEMGKYVYDVIAQFAIIAVCVFALIRLNSNDTDKEKEN